MSRHPKANSWPLKYKNAKHSPGSVLVLDSSVQAADKGVEVQLFRWGLFVFGVFCVELDISSRKKRWGSCWSFYWCFGSHKNSERIGHAVLVPEPVAPGAAVSTAENVSNPTGVVMPFIAPPSSPASFLQSDPPSATQSPSAVLSLTALSVNAYSPRGPASIFAIGPYAHENQLVTPPVFSTLTTEPSTGPFTPPPESVQLTTPSSPEACQIYPGSPGGNLISPGLGSGSLTPVGLGQGSIASNPKNGPKTDEIIVDHRVSFELNGEDIARCLKNKSLVSSRTMLDYEYPKGLAEQGRVQKDGLTKDQESSCELFIGDTSKETDEKVSGEAEEDHCFQKHRSFNFDNRKGEASGKPTVRSEWWANEKVSGKEARPSNDWSFFPMLQPEVS
ncbi:Hcf106 protein [Hibiscus syriacus]|uniref:Hcf106 protein n=1 Tax=Hibiscus syriacus TaxID=106335 RepID=A0A6A3C556_HIBSY|nr:Hcf106 protein [Hibiscus syriacus]